MRSSQYIYQRIRANHTYRWYPTAQEAAWLEPLEHAEYQHIVQALCADPVGNNRHLQGMAFRATYQWHTYGCVLSILRPDPLLYRDLLQAILRIDDPSSNAVGVVAVQQVQSLAYITRDLLQHFVTVQHESTLADNITALFYWLCVISPGQYHVYDLPNVLSLDYLQGLWVPRDLPPTDATQWSHVRSTIQQLLHAIDLGRPQGQKVQQYATQILRDVE